MGCLLIAIAFFMPRVMLFVGWLTGFFAQSDPWETKIWPFLGFLFMPATTLVFGAAHVYNGGAFEGGWLVAMVVAVIYDLGTNGSSTTQSNS